MPISSALLPATPLPQVVHVTPDRGPVPGHDPRSLYVERFWLPILGPTGTWLMRNFAYRFDHDPDGFTLDLRYVASALGVSVDNSSHAFKRTLERCERLGMLSLNGDTLTVSTSLRTLTVSLVARLPLHLQAAHRDWYRQP